MNEPAVGQPTGRQSTAAQPTEVLAGSIERVTFHNAENGFCVLRIKARGHRDLVTVVGHAAEISAGEWVTVSGTWVNSREHGQQFKASFLRASAPTTAEGIEKYLGSGMIRGIGPIYASKLVAVFGDQVFEVIEQAPERLREVPGIGPVRGQRISQAWADQKVVREIMVFLHSHGVGTARAVRIFKTYGNDAVQVMAENPYRLARDIRGIGFRTADAIAARLGIEPEAMIRLRAGISYALLEASGEGHCGLPSAELLKLAGELLAVERPSGPLDETGATSRVPLESGLIESALDLELSEGAVVADTLAAEPAIFLSNLHRDERRIAASLQELVAGTPPWGAIDSAKAVPWVEQRLGLELAASQKAGGGAGPLQQGAGDHRRARGGQDHLDQRHPAHPGGQEAADPALRPHRPCRQADERNDRAGGQNHPPAAGVRPGGLRLQAQRRAATGVRTAGGG